jgi:rod shape-determining protein MreC
VQTRSGSWWLVVLVILVVLSLALHETGQLKPVEDLLMIVIGPVQRLVSDLVGSSTDLFQTFRDARALRAENRRLQEANDVLTAENIYWKEIAAENATLREMFQFKRNNPNYQMLAAEVIGRDSNSLFRSLIISLGELDGIWPAMPVVAGGARLVGQVTQVFPRSSKVRLLTDAASAVNARIERNRATGSVRGRPDGSLVLEFVKLDNEIEIGDIILTSGLGGNFPRALIIGQVSEVERRDIDLFQSAYLRPAVNMEQLEIVLVITNFEPMLLPETP